MIPSLFSVGIMRLRSKAPGSVKNGPGIDQVTPEKKKHNDLSTEIT